MKYRGQDYSGSQQQISTIASKNTACYRGRKYFTFVYWWQLTSLERQILR